MAASSNRMDWSSAEKDLPNRPRTTCRAREGESDRCRGPSPMADYFFSSFTSFSAVLSSAV